MAAFSTRPEIRGTFGAVASTHWLASAVGMSILEKGGNAFDAAAAAGFTLQVVEPHLNGPLGEAPILVWSEVKRRCDMICGQGVAPAAATIGRFRALGLDLIPGTGLLAAAVPAAFGAWMRLLRDWGTMPLAEILTPAIGYAEKGYPVVERISETIAVMSEMFRREWPSSAAIYLPDGKPPVSGRLFRNPALAATYRRVLAEAGDGTREGQIERARAAWYHGFVAGAIDRFCREEKILDSSGRRHAGLLTGDDLALWEPPVEKPLSFDYRGWTVIKGGPWSQGPVLLQTLALLQGFDLDDLDPLGADFVHTVVECLKLAFADREAWYGDPDFVEVPMDTLLSSAYNNARRRLVGDRASLELRPGGPDCRRPRILVGGHEAAIAAAGIGEPTMSQRGVVAGDTCHIDVRRPLGQHGVRDAVGRLAAEFAGYSRTGLLPRHEAADVVARRGVAGQPRTGQASAQHPVAVDGVQGRRALHGVWHARWRPAGPVVGADASAPCPSPDEFAGGDRLPGLSHRAPAEFVLSARRPARAGGSRRAFPRNNPRRPRRARPSPHSGRAVV